MSDYIGIDYALGTANRDPNRPEMHYGAISQHSFWSHDAEPIYPEPEATDLEIECDDCGHSWIDFVQPGEAGICPECQAPVEAPDSDMELGEPIGWKFDGEETIQCDDIIFGVFVTGSPYYTRAKYCSPCAPGAGDLDAWHPQGVKTYCLGPDWFTSGYPLIYPIWRVDDDTLVAGAELLEDAHAED